MYRPPGIRQGYLIETAENRQRVETGDRHRRQKRCCAERSLIEATEPVPIFDCQLSAVALEVVPDARADLLFEAFEELGLFAHAVEVLHADAECLPVAASP